MNFTLRGFLPTFFLASSALLLSAGCESETSTQDSKRFNINNFQSSITDVVAGEPTSVVWSWDLGSSNDSVASCSIDHGVGQVSNGSESLINIDTDTVFTLTCELLGGQFTATVTIKAWTNPVAPVLQSFLMESVSGDIYADIPNEITFSWEFKKVPVPLGTCTVNQGVGLVANGETKTVTPSIGQTRYQLVCTNIAGSDSLETEIEMSPPDLSRIGRFSITPGIIAANKPKRALIRFTGFNDAESQCSIDNGVGPVESGDEVNLNLSEPTTFTLTCMKGGNSDSSSFDVYATDLLVRDEAYTAISAGSGYTCGILEDRTLSCWGLNHARAAEPPPGQFTQITTGSGFACGIRVDGQTICWGKDDFDLLSVPNKTFVSLDAGVHYVCGIEADGVLTCWGDMSDGKGMGNPDSRYLQVSAGWNHSCAVKTDHSVECFGRPSFFNYLDAPEGAFSAVTVGHTHSCGIRQDGTVECWGDSNFSQLDGQGSYGTSIESGARRTCTLTTPNGGAHCWGGGGFSAGFPRLDQKAGGFGSFSSVSTGISDHTCGILSYSGQPECWGKINSGTTPPKGGFLSVSADRNHTCGIRVDGSVLCWGSNLGNDLACDPNESGCRSTQADGKSRPPEENFTAISVGENHSCGIKEDQSIACWGSNERGQSNAPEGRFIDIAAGEIQSCAIGTDQKVSCWGTFLQSAFSSDETYLDVDVGYVQKCAVKSNNDLQCQVEPERFDGSYKAVSVSEIASFDRVCAIRMDNTVRCWELSSPTGTFEKIAVGRAGACGIRTNKTLDCWDVGPGLTPPPSGTFSSVSVGGGYACAVRENGLEVCWGGQVR